MIGEETNDTKGPVMQTTLGNLIAVLCEETRPFLENDRDLSLVVSYILNDLMLRNRDSRVGLGTTRPACARERRKRGDNYENCLSRKGMDFWRIP